jgi:hypothetical protein
MPQSSGSNGKASTTVCDCGSGAGGRDKGHGINSIKLTLSLLMPHSYEYMELLVKPEI